jgi:hypothetical protein
MRWVVEMDSGGIFFKKTQFIGMTYIPSFLKTDSGTQKLIGLIQKHTESRVIS